MTAEFNLNVLRVINASLGADFDVSSFDHVAAVGPRGASGSRCVCASSRAQRVRVPALDLTVDFATGEEMRTEISAKFRRERVAAEVGAAGLRLDQWWTDPAGDFALSLSFA